MNKPTTSTGAPAAFRGADSRPVISMRRAACLIGCGVSLALMLSGCAQVREKPALPTIQEEMRLAAAAPAPAPLPAAVAAALAPPSKLQLPRSSAQAVEPRFDLAVNNASAQQVFMGIASGTRYSMLLQPEVAGSITVNLKDVSVPEAMSAMRELYGYEYRIDGNQIFVQPLTSQTRFYTVSYPTSVRQGKSELRVISGAVTDSAGGGASGAAPTQSSRQLETSRLSTDQKSDFWGELQSSVGLLIGCAGQAGGALTCPPERGVMTSPATGMLAVRALPMEQRIVNEYLKAARVTVERQVMIEAKIIEVSLNEGAQSGINWAAIGSSHASPFALSGNIGQATFPSTAYPFINTATEFGALNMAASGTMLGLAFQTDSFAALVRFLETQGQVQVLSSPRIAAINNQKAVLKVGTDEFFVTNVSTTTSTGTGSGTTTPNVTLQPFFSGISLDVTPQIDDADNIILHVHPSISYVTETTKNIALGGSGLSSISLPLAVSQISETDSIVRLRNGEIAAIGGLMKRESRDDGSGVPGLGKIPLLGALFKSSNVRRTKQELVILLKPTLIKQQSDWLDSARESSARIREFDSPAPAPR
ncbi:MAG: pilus (MSHA type) biogenesis protein MshL [Pseudomonadota bacterium]|nr:pilus (MSHA type) biogenesis protein MshL [Pseudomonadota bacterium]MDP1903829.1 pilus (MSHA type) biogenesis protein MshL [Pseudomonadota bacterium]MDP2353673.1 pilus (MSHA type) biogenesis protein MshL [Pseudomonadota bacterium]